MLRFRFHVFPFFFFFFRVWTVTSHGFTVHHCLCTIHYCSCTVYVLKNIKNGSHDTIHAFKNYFATVLSVFSFSNNKLNLNGPIVNCNRLFIIFSFWERLFITFYIGLLFFFTITIGYNHSCQNCDPNYKIAWFYDLTSPKSLKS